MASAAGLAMSPQERKSFSDFERRVESGEPEALYRMSAILEHGYDSIPADTLRSLRFLRMAAMKGYAPAQNYLGYLFQEGKMLEASPDSAFYWISRAADLGHPGAITNLVYYRTEDGRVIFDEVAALDRLAPSDADALKNGVDFYRRGAWPIAVELLRRVSPESPQAPHAYALLGEAYSRGRGVAYDYTRALSYYARAAALGNPSAKFVIAETLEFFPDALVGIVDEIPDPNELRNDALSHGIFSAEQAAERLLEIIP